MNIIGDIGLKAARQILSNADEHSVFYSPEKCDYFQGGGEAPNDALLLSDIRKAVDSYDISLHYGSPSHTKQYLEDNVLHPDKESEIKNALAYFRDVEGLDI